MGIEIGSTVEGTIVKIADYGAIVRLQGGKTGLIHISEIADTFVRDVKEYFKEQDRVRVKVLSVNAKGRYELSTKQVEQPILSHPEPPKPAQREPEPVYLGPEDVPNFGASQFNDCTFEERMSRFVKESEERLLQLKRNIENKRGGKKR